MIIVNQQRPYKMLRSLQNSLKLDKIKEKTIRRTHIRKNAVQKKNGEELLKLLATWR